MTTTIFGGDFGVVSGVDPGQGLKYRLYTASGTVSYNVSIGPPTILNPTDSYYVFDGSAAENGFIDSIDTSKGGTFAGGIGNDTLVSNETYTVDVGPIVPVRLFGGGGNDLINPPAQVINSIDAAPVEAYGGRDDDVIYGGGANDTLYGDKQDGFTGYPTIASFTPAPYDSTGDGNDVVYGLGGDDTIEGNGGEDRLFGGDGADTLKGGAGRDFLFGGPRGRGDLDVLTGGADADAFMLSYAKDDSNGGAAFWESYFASSAEDFAGSTIGSVVQNIINNETAEIAAGILGASLGAGAGVVAEAFVELVESLLPSATPEATKQDVMVITDFDPRQDILMLPLQQTVMEALTAKITTKQQVPGGGNSNSQAKVLELKAGNKVYAYVELSADFLTAMGIVADSDDAEQILKNIITSGTTLQADGDKVGFTGLVSPTISSVLPDGGFQPYKAALPAGSAVAVYGAVGGLVISNEGSVAYGAILAGTDYVDILSTNPKLIGFDQLLLSGTAATIHGFGGGDVIYGTGEADTLFGDDGDDTVYSFSSQSDGQGGIYHESVSGGAGNDVLYGGGSAGTFDGGDGADTFGVVYLPLSGPNMQLEVDLTAGYAAERALPSDTTAPVGSTAPFPGTGADKVPNNYTLTSIENAIGGPANDWIKAASGSSIEGAAGADYLIAAAGNVTLSYASSAAAVTVQLFQTSATTANGDAQGDVIAYGDVSDVVGLVGSANNDVLGAYSDAGSSSNPFEFLGGGGSDTFQLLGSASTGLYAIGDFAESATEQDLIDLRPLGVTDFGAVQQDGNSVFVYDSPGGGGALLAFVELANFTQTLTAGDFLLASAVSGKAQARNGGDGLVGSDGSDTLLGGDGWDFLFGEGGDDVIVGGAGADVMAGGGGRDRLVGGDGIDRMDGGQEGDLYIADGDILHDTGTTGIDAAITERSTTLALDSGIEVLRGEGGSTSNLTLTGNALENRLIGNDGDNLLRGLGEVDSLFGGLGNDRLLGGRERDKQTGDAGADTFIFHAGDSDPTATTFDVVHDFLTGVDKIDLDTIGAGGLPAAAYSEASVASDTFGAAQTVAAAVMAGGSISVMFVAGTTNGWLFWSTDSNNTTVEQAVRLNGANSLGAFDCTDLI